MLFGCNLSARAQSDHLIAEILIKDSAIKIEERLGSASLNHGLMEFAVISLPEFYPFCFIRQPPPLHSGEFVMSRDDPAFPFKITYCTRQRQRIALKEQPHGGHILQTLG